VTKRANKIEFVRALAFLFHSANKLWFPPLVLQIEKPLVDPAIRQSISLSKCVQTHHREVYVPTGALFLVQTLARCFASAHLVLSDFSHFPGQIEPKNSPTKNIPSVHYSTDSGSVEFDSIPASPPYSADIYFPTNFYDLKRMYEALIPGAAPKLFTNEEFMLKYQSPTEIGLAATRSGYNPLLKDYSNTKFFCTWIKYYPPWLTNSGWRQDFKTFPV